MLKVALTHDIDRTAKTYQYLTHLIKALKQFDIYRAVYQITSMHQSNNVYWNFEEIISIESSYGVKSTFFFLIESIKFNLFDISNWKLSLGRYDIEDPKIISILQYLDINGWEIGLHGSYNSFSSPVLLDHEKNKLENILNHKIIGVRQHYLKLNSETWKIQYNAGFLYDSSWGFTRDIGFKEGRIKPFSPFQNNFTVFPLAIMDFCYMNKSNRKTELMNIINICNSNDAILVINWHNDIFNEKETPGYKRAYSELIEICLTNNAKFDTLANYYKLL